MKNLIVRFYIEVTTISAIRDTYPVATTTTAEDTAISIDFNIITPLIEREGYLALSLLILLDILLISSS